MAIGTPASKIPKGTNVKPGTAKPGTSANAVLGNSIKPVAKPAVNRPVATGVSKVMGGPIKTGKPKPMTGTATNLIGGIKPNPKPGPNLAGTLAGGNTGGLTKPAGPSIPSADVIDQQQIRNLWHMMQYGDGQSQGIQSYADQIQGLAKDNFARFNTAVHGAQQGRDQNMQDTNAQAAASGMLSSGGVTTSHMADQADYRRQYNELNDTIGGAAVLKLGQQSDQMRNFYMQQILGLLGGQRDQLMGIVNGE